MSITVDKGHGYLKLVHDEAVQGGWIEIGQTIISRIAPDMLITVPEGSYSVRLSGAGVEETREVTIERNQETGKELGEVLQRLLDFVVEDPSRNKKELLLKEAFEISL